MQILIAVLAVLAVGGTVVYFLKRRAILRANDEMEISEEEYNRHYEAKQAALETILGRMHEVVGHAIIPFHIGGTVDMYYFPNGIPGTGFATMELIAPDGSGPKPNRIGTYELVAFTKHEIPDNEGDNEATPFKEIERRICGLFTTTGFYSYNDVLNPGETCEVPLAEGEPNRCLLFDEYAPDGKTFVIDGKKHCLLLCLEVFRSEMVYAMEHGSAAVIRKLKDEGHYPYSDLDREPVC